MSDLKIEPRLEEEISTAEAAGRSVPAIPIIIELASPIDAPSDEEPEAGLQRMERRAEELQRPVIARLDELGARDVQRFALTNALYTILTPAQIREIAGHPDVKLVRLSREEQVTT